MQIVPVLQNLFAKKYYYFISFIVFFTPLIFVGNTNELFEFPKTFFIYFSALVLILFAGYDHLISGKIKFKFLTPLPVLLYLTAVIISTVFSQYLYTSVWGYYTRFNDGLMSALSFYVLYLAVVNTLNKKEMGNVFMVMVFGTLPVGILGIAQHYGVIPGIGEVPRVYSTFGQPNWLAQYFVLTLPLCLYYLIRDKRSYMWGMTYLLGHACLWFTYSLSGMAGYFIGMLILGAIIYREGVNRGQVVRLCAVLLGALIICILNPGMFGERAHDFIKDLRFFTDKKVAVVYAQDAGYSEGSASGGDYVSGNASSSSSESASGEEYKISDPGFIRSGLWRGTFNMITSDTKTFLIGTGPETFPYFFQPFRPKELNYSSEWNYVFNKPHNYYLETWAESGLVGLTAYLGMILYTLRKSERKYLPGILGFCVTNIFGWPVVGTATIFWILAASAEVKDA